MQKNEILSVYNEWIYAMHSGTFSERLSQDTIDNQNPHERLNHD